MSAFPAVSELVPHVAPMLVLDRLVEWEPGRARAEATVRASTSLAWRGHIRGSALLEYMAQAVAACLGYEAYQGGEGVRVGMVIACRSFEAHCARIECGERLTISVERVRGSDFVSHFDGEVRGEDDEVLATSTMTLVHGDPRKQSG